ncbi:MAG: GTP cyclohydrolase II RibA [Candidatus Symbiobacter sp.]|nr:GTP cyclohydrolase II RibA [Candidatus Symbiobacter sp.]
MDKHILPTNPQNPLDSSQQAELALAVEWLRRNLPVALIDHLDMTWVMLAIDGATTEQIQRFFALRFNYAPMLVLGIYRAQSLGLTPEYTSEENDPFLIELPYDTDDAIKVIQGIQANTPTKYSLKYLNNENHFGDSASATGAARLGQKLLAQCPLMPQFLLIQADLRKFSGLAANGIWHISPAISEYLYADNHLVASPALQKIDAVAVPLLNAAQARITGWRDKNTGQEHLAIMIGKVNARKPVLTRIHSSCLTGDGLGSLRCDCGEQLQGAIRLMAANPDGGVILYLTQEGRGIGLINKLRSYQLQSDGMDTIDANHRLGFAADRRDYRVAAEMLQQMGITEINLLSNNPLKTKQIMLAAAALGGELKVNRISHKFPPNPHNQNYLATKKSRAGHDL